MNVNDKAPHRALTLRLPAQLHDAVARAAAENGLSLTAYLRFLATRDIRRQNAKVA